MSASAFIAGCSGTSLTPDERAFFRTASPWGFILFRRNIADRPQLRALVDDLRACVGWRAPVLIDQEGGRVQRMGPPNWPKYPAARQFLTINDTLARREAVRLNARLIAHDLADVGIDVDCLPVLDVPVAGAHDVIGDRAHAHEPDEVAVLGRAAAEGLLAGAVLPVIKHVPGHGRAMADSHHDLPVVDAPREALAARDFRPFRHLADMPLAMTAHVVYTAIDPDRPATQSRKVVRGIIRGEIGFDGLLMTDDLSMKALRGSFRARAEAAIAAGCDVVLHCNGVMSEMEEVATAVPRMTGLRGRRARAALSRISHAPEPLDAEAVRARLATLLAAAA